MPGLTKLEDVLWIATRATGVLAYDFKFEDFFVCKHPIYLGEPIQAVARMGAFDES